MPRKIRRHRRSPPRARELKSANYKIGNIKSNNMPSVSSAQSEASCRKPYYRKRRYRCPGKRRYKAKGRCCKHPQKITLCNRNWVRISVNPFINFLRCYKRQFPKKCPISYIAREGRKVWKKMSRSEKKPFYEQAKRAKKRGFRT